MSIAMLESLLRLRRWQAHQAELGQQQAEGALRVAEGAVAASEQALAAAHTADADAVLQLAWLPFGLQQRRDRQAASLQCAQALAQAQAVVVEHRRAARVVEEIQQHRRAEAEAARWRREEQALEGWSQFRASRPGLRV